MHLSRLFAFALAAIASFGIAGAQNASTPAIPLSGANAVFAKAHALCEADNGRLWGISLCGPLMLADPQTHQAVANTPVAGATKDDGLYRLTLPANFPISDAPAQYGGMRWAMVRWPLATDADEQAVTLMHESFHRIQPRLGFNGDADVSISGVPSLDSEAGRIWLRGELSALRIALTSMGAGRTAALNDALAMRAYRHNMFPAAAQPEANLDVLEGLAESTGIDIGLPADQRVAYAVHDIALVDGMPSYVRAIPYGTGPAYSMLLDAVSSDWRRKVTPSSDLAEMAAAAYGIKLSTPTASQAQAIISQYGGAAIEREEAARAAEKLALNRTYRSEFVTGTTLRLPMTHFNITFNPSDVEQFENLGSVYHNLTVNAPWGSITVSSGDALISPDFKLLTVAAPPTLAGPTLEGKHWVLRLSPDAKIVPDAGKPGSYLVTPPSARAQKG
ncbi:MAG TPA: hypothetical protein VGI19_18340 [Candidatus Cybelea sp.]|jgi:hypothetical protein